MITFITGRDGARKHHFLKEARPAFGLLAVMAAYLMEHLNLRADADP